VFVDQPGQDPPGGMTLLARRVEVGLQHRVDQLLQRLEPRRTPHRRLTRQRTRVVQRLTNRAPMHAMPLG
jgi:hypothetical protein